VQALNALLYVFVLLSAVVPGGNSALADAGYDPFSDCRVTAEQEEERRFCEQWDSKLQVDAYRCGGALLPGLLSPCANSRYGEMTVLQNDNENIVERVLTLYIAEYQYWLKRSLQDFEKADKAAVSDEQWQTWVRHSERSRALLARSVERHGDLYRELPMDSPGRTEGYAENELEYMDVLSVAAGSTYSPRIYEEVWGFPVPSNHHAIYLAEVDPARTIHALTHATEASGARHHKEGSDILFTARGGHAVTVEDAFEILLLVCEHQRHTAMAHADAIRAFVDRYSLHYSGNGHRSSMAVYDFAVRYRALKIISCIGTVEDAPLVRRIKKDPPERRPSKAWIGLQGDASITQLADRVLVGLE
jgi:hypothetical protein